MVYPRDGSFRRNLMDPQGMFNLPNDREMFAQNGVGDPGGIGGGSSGGGVPQQTMQQMPMPVFPDMQFQAAPDGMIDFNAQAMQLAGPLPDMSQYFGQPMTNQPQTGGSPAMQPDVGQPGGLLGQPGGIGGGPYIDPRTGMPTGGNEMPVNLPNQGNGQSPASPEPPIPDSGMRPPISNTPTEGLFGMQPIEQDVPTTNAPANQQDLLRRAIALRGGGGNLDPMQALSLMRRLQGNRGMF